MGYVKMFKVTDNPYSKTLNKLFNDLKNVEWSFPYIVQFVHSFITVILLIILLLLYLTLGFISQISNTFWNHLTSIGQNMSYSSPIQSLFYALSVSLYFILFLPFFIFQLPFWFSGWITSKIGFKFFIIVLITIMAAITLHLFKPNITKASIAQIVKIHDSIKTEYFEADSLNKSQDEVLNNQIILEN